MQEIIMQRMFDLRNHIKAELAMISELSEAITVESNLKTIKRYKRDIDDCNNRIEKHMEELQQIHEELKQ